MKTIAKSNNKDQKKAVLDSFEHLITENVEEADKIGELVLRVMVNNINEVIDNSNTNQEESATEVWHSLQSARSQIKNLIKVFESEEFKSKASKSIDESKHQVFETNINRLINEMDKEFKKIGSYIITNFRK